MDFKFFFLLAVALSCVTSSLAIDTNGNGIDDQCESSQSASAVGDPHFSGFQGQRFDFDGIPFRVFNLLTASSLQVNSRFFPNQEFSGQTVLGELGLQSGSGRVFISCTNSTLRVEVEGGTVTDTVPVLFGEDGMVWLEERNRVATVQVSPFKFTVKRHKTRNLGCFLDLTAEVWGSVEKGEADGILGRTLYEHVEIASDQNLEEFLVRSDSVYGTDFPVNLFTDSHSGQFRYGERKLLTRKLLQTVCGCTDSSAVNFETASTHEDGSCLYMSNNSTTAAVYINGDCSSTDTALLLQAVAEALGVAPNTISLEEITCTPTGDSRRRLLAAGEFIIVFTVQAESESALLSMLEANSTALDDALASRGLVKSKDSARVERPLKSKVVTSSNEVEVDPCVVDGQPTCDASSFCIAQGPSSVACLCTGSSCDSDPCSGNPCAGQPQGMVNCLSVLQPGSGTLQPECYGDDPRTLCAPSGCAVQGQASNNPVAEAGVPPCSGPSCSIQTDGLVLLYDFENANAVTGSTVNNLFGPSGLSGSIVTRAGKTWGVDIDVQLSNSPKHIWSHEGGHISVNNANLMGFDSTDEMTMGVWMQQFPRVGPVHELHGYGYNSQTYQWVPLDPFIRLGIFYPSGSITPRPYLNFGDHIDQHPTTLDNGSVLDVSEWYELVMTISPFNASTGVREGRLFINGEHAFTYTTALPSLASPAYFSWLGAEENLDRGVSHFVKAKVGRMYIYNRALSTQEVQTNHENTKATYLGAIAPPSPVGSASPSVSATTTRSISYSASMAPSVTASGSGSASRTASMTPSVTTSESGSASRTASVTPSVTTSETGSASRTASMTPSVTTSKTGSASRTASVTPSVTTSETGSASRTPSMTPSVTTSETGSASRTASTTSSPSQSRTSSATASSSLTQSRSPSGTPSHTSSQSKSPSITASMTASRSSSKTATSSATPSGTATSSVSPSVTSSRSASQTSSTSPTPSVTASKSMSPSSSASMTASASRSATASRTPSSSKTPSTSVTMTVTPTPSLSATSSASKSATPSATPPFAPCGMINDEASVNVGDLMISSRSSTCMLSTANKWVVVYASKYSSSSSDIRFRLFDQHGLPTTSERDVYYSYSASPADESDPQCVAWGDKFAVVWWDGQTQTAKFRYFGQYGDPVTPEYELNSIAISNGKFSVSQAPGNDEMAIAWQESDGFGEGISLMRIYYGGSFSPSSKKLVNELTYGDQMDPSLSMVGEELLVAWGTTVYGGLNVAYRRFHGYSLDPLSGEVKLPVATTGYQTEGSISSLPNDGYIVTWTEDLRTYSCLYNAFHQQVRPCPFNIFTARATASRVAAYGTDGSFVVAFQSMDMGGSGHAIGAQWFDPAGNMWGNPVTVVSHSSGDQSFPSVAALDTRGIVMSWTSASQNGASYGIYMKGFCIGFTCDAPWRYTFSNLGTVGRLPPGDGDLEVYHTNHGQSRIGVSAGLQTWTLPCLGVYRITVTGARGDSQCGRSGGLGTSMRGDFVLAKGSQVVVAVGQDGTDGAFEETCGDGGSGGGGGTCAWNPSDTSQPLICAGGGAGVPDSDISVPANYQETLHATISTTGRGQGAGTSGAAGQTHFASGGAGFLEDSVAAQTGSAYAFLHGAVGADGFQVGGPRGNGGFGGGGGAWNGGGAGGGYSGGGAFDGCCSGGGGSYNGGSNQANYEQYADGGSATIELVV